MHGRLAEDPSAKGVREPLILGLHLIYFVAMKVHGGVDIRLSSLGFLRINFAAGSAREAFLPQSYDELVANVACII